jgi:hypothetical protein
MINSIICILIALCYLTLSAIYFTEGDGLGAIVMCIGAIAFLYVMKMERKDGQGI